MKIIIPAMNCQIPVEDEVLDEANHKLARYAGSVASLYRFTASHSRAIIEVKPSGHIGDFYSYEHWSFGFVDRICMPTGWRMVRPSVRRNDETSFIFSDAGGIELVAVELTVTPAITSMYGVAPPAR